jgi:2-oxoglutarate dehydrogenase E1 component
MTDWHEFHGPNAGYILHLYEQYQVDPTAVDGATRTFFEQWIPPADRQGAAGAAVLGEEASLPEIVGAVNLAHSIRSVGYLAAQLDPLGTSPDSDPTLTPETHGLTPATLKNASPLPNRRTGRANGCGMLSDAASYLSCPTCPRVSTI